MSNMGLSNLIQTVFARFGGKLILTVVIAWLVTFGAGGSAVSIWLEVWPEWLIVLKLSLVCLVAWALNEIRKKI